jgi:alpha-mannosidase
MHDRTVSGEERAAVFLAERLRPALYPQRLPMDVGAWHLAGEPVPAAVALRADYAPFTVGEPWGRPWSTSWCDMRAAVPERWAGRRVEALIDLGAQEGTAPGLGGGARAHRGYVIHRRGPRQRFSARASRASMFLA